MPYVDSLYSSRLIQRLELRCMILQVIPGCLLLKMLPAAAHSPGALQAKGIALGAQVPYA